MRNYYEKLGVSPELSCEEIKAEIVEAYGALTEEQQAMYDVITNIETRVVYDRWLQNASEPKERYDYINGEFYQEPTAEELLLKENAYNKFFALKSVSAVIDHNERQYDLEQVFAAEENQDYLKRAEIAATSREAHNKLAVINPVDTAIEVVDNDELDLEPLLPAEIEELYLMDDDNVVETIEEPNVVVTSVNKNRLWKGVAGIAALALAGAIIAASANSCSNEKEGNGIHTVVTPTENPKATEKPEPTKAPVATVTPTPTPVVTVTPTPVQPINPSTVEEVNSENIEGLTQYFVDAVTNKGLVFNAKLNGEQVELRDAVRGAILVANIENISKDEMEKMVPELDMFAQYQLANLYLCAVNSYNISNVVVAKQSNEFMSIADLVFDKTDKALLLELEKELNSLCSGKTDTAESFELITKWYEGKRGIETTEGKIKYNDAKIGTKYLAEVGLWANFSVAYTISDLVLTNPEILDEIESMETNTIDGARYLYEISSYGKDKVKTR